MKLSVNETHKRYVFNNFMQYFMVTCGIHEHEGCRYSMPNADFPLFNSILDTDVESHKVIDIMQFMQQRYQSKMQYCWWMTDFVNPQSLGQALQEQGFTKESPFMGMSLDLSSHISIPSDLQHIKVHCLTVKEHFAKWAIPLQVSFALDDNSTLFLVNTLKRLFDDARFKHFYVEKDNNIVGVGSLFIENGVGGLYNLGVLPEYRNRKIATALKYHRLKFSQMMGAKVAILQSSIMGKDLDQRLGFKPIMAFVPYLSPLKG